MRMLRMRTYPPALCLAAWNRLSMADRFYLGRLTLMRAQIGAKGFHRGCIVALGDKDHSAALLGGEQTHVVMSLAREVSSIASRRTSNRSCAATGALT